ncbi:hypothetical protein [Laspinema olomoucense]|uniref:hypothetical protein n=1 Tax=Laspinema olomoucense TaxID=3231600 RepID=UPI0021BA8903|nr:hypothetical protein [Laspinema sp. D3d]MCT7971110.1 hypothetical protein [Laspinema sp. D3d]
MPLNPGMRSPAQSDRVFIFKTFEISDPTPCQSDSSDIYLTFLAGSPPQVNNSSTIYY